MFFWLARKVRRSVLSGRPLPPGWEAQAVKHFPFVDTLEANERGRFFLHLKVFAHEKNWEGAKGLVVTEEMKIVVSGAAARLSRNLALDVYDDLKTVLLYDQSFVGQNGAMETYGEAHQRGLVILAWDKVRHGLARPEDGHDVALHELAHALDAADKAFDGTPDLGLQGDYRTWAKVFHKHYTRLKTKPQLSVLNRYGATNEAEFFAVATETFFEKPSQLQKKAPDLYDALKAFYGCDPVINK
jgi:MtfA peptidase